MENTSQKQKIIQMYILHDEYIKEILKEKERILLISVPYIEVIEGNKLTFKINEKYNKIMYKLDSLIENRIEQIKKANYETN